MLPPLPQFFADAAWRHMVAFSQKLGERAGVWGPFYNAAINESPLIRPIGHLLPRGGEGSVLRTANFVHKIASVDLSRQTWRCPLKG